MSSKRSDKIPKGYGRYPWPWPGYALTWKTHGSLSCPYDYRLVPVDYVESEKNDEISPDRT